MTLEKCIASSPQHTLYTQYISLSKFHTVIVTDSFGELGDEELLGKAQKVQCMLGKLYKTLLKLYQ